ncbi:MAG: trigger factor [Clostridia bacterium]|nr:trigger factor [Clostridia bacterium]
MTATKEDLGSNRVRLEIDVPAARFQESIDKVYRSSRGEFTIPGFRKGKAPRAVIESHYGPGTFYNRAFDDLFPEVYSSAVSEVGVVPVGPPENLKFLEVDGSKGIRFTVEFYVVPEVTLGNYEGLKATRHHHTVSEAEIDERLKALQEENARWVETEDAAENGDRIKIDFSGSIGGEPFEGGQAEGYDLTLGSHTFIDGFEEQLTGMKPGEERDVTVTFPEDYPASEVAGKDAVFAVRLGTVKRKELPEIDDDFAEDVSEFDTVEDLRAGTRERLQKIADDRLEAQLESDLIRQVVDDSEMDIPKIMIDSEIEDRLRRMQQQLIFQGMTLDDYFAATGTDPAAFTDAMRPEAESAIKLQLVMPELIRALDTAPTEEELKNEYARIAADRDTDVEEFVRQMSSAQKEAVASQVALRKTMDRLKEISEITDAAEDAAEETAPEG